MPEVFTCRCSTVVRGRARSTRAAGSTGRASPTRSCRRPPANSSRRWGGPRRPTSAGQRRGRTEAQRAWAAAPYNERAAVLRRAGDLWHANAEEITGWLMRETGAIGPFGGFQIMTSAEECYEAAALASAPYGELLRSSMPRLSMARRLPVGVVGVIAPFNVPTILSIRAVAPALALGNAVLLKPDPRTAVSGGAVLAEIFAQAGLPDGLLHVLPGGADVGEALVVEPARPGDRLHRVDQGRPRRGCPGRAAPQAGAPRARRQLRAAGARRRRRRSGVLGRGVGVVRPSGPGLHGGRPAPGGVVDRRRLRLRAGRAGRQAAGRRPGVGAGRPRPGHRRGAAGQDPRDW